MNNFSEIKIVKIAEGPLGDSWAVYVDDDLVAGGIGFHQAYSDLSKWLVNKDLFERIHIKRVVDD